jgi:polysaccharide pyruvyl transferase WcaK-like protein
VRIHLGHHFYGAGNLGDDFMLAGFLGAMRTIEPAATFSGCVPFALPPLQRRFPAVAWQPYDNATRARCIQACDLWVGLGGSPFQSAVSRWFVDHLVTEAETCNRERKPMYFLGVGVQTADELKVPDVRRVCSEAAGIWTRDAGSAQRLRTLPGAPLIEEAADLAHVYFREASPPPAKSGRVTVVANLDFASWPGQSAALAALRQLPAHEHVWLAQESRALPGAERNLYAGLSPAEQAQWRLVVADEPGAQMDEVLTRWPSGEWLLTARYHAALAGAWAGSRIVVLDTNEKLRAVADELRTPLVRADADEDTIARAFQRAPALAPPHERAERAYAACAAVARSAVAHQR